MRSCKVPNGYDENRCLLDLTVREALGMKVCYWNDSTQRFRFAIVMQINRHKRYPSSWYIEAKRGSSRIRLQAGRVYIRRK